MKNKDNSEQHSMAIPTPGSSNDKSSSEQQQQQQQQQNTTTPDGQQQQQHLHLASGGIFTMKEYKTLSIICDTIISNDSLLFTQQQQGQQIDSKILEFYKRSASDLDIASQFLKLICQTKSKSQIDDVKTLLYLFSSPMGIILTGTFSSFCSLPLEKRQEALRRMKDSVNPIRRQAFKAFSSLIVSLFLTVLPENGTNPNWEALKYPIPPPNEQIPGQENLSFIKINSDRSLKADVVIIGSGAGGGVTASVLSQAGYKVIVLEKGSYIPPSNMTWKEAEAFPLMYEQAGTMTTDDLGINIFAGSCLGGGTTVNWSASIKTPDHVLEEWRKECPNTFAEEKYQDAIDKVQQRLNVNTEYSILNKSNKLLNEGLNQLGLDSNVIPRNVKNCDTTQCGYCSMGCRSKSKQSSMVSFLEDACSNGCQIITNCHAEEITHTTSPQGFAAHGVISTVTLPDGERFRVFIKANIVVCAAGALHTPAVLLRSKFKNPMIGKTLYLHPVCPTIGVFEDSVDIWEGVPMSIISRKFQERHGSIIEVPSAHLGVAGSLGTFKWQDSLTFKHDLLNIKNWCSFIPILRDSNPGTVKLDKDKRSPKVTYKLSNQDWKNSLPGIEGALRTLVSAGAKSIGVPIPGLPMAESKDLENYIKTIRNFKYKTNLVSMFSAHQMGSCRMGSSRSNSVVKETGESWDVAKLFIADGSVLPTAVGVNPMITIYATSFIIANNIISLYPPPPSTIAYERGI
eukprot:gene5860-7289_t